eukprot:scaffold680928_cov62-Prasinocladus_malaysianus.AAC.1
MTNKCTYKMLRCLYPCVVPIFDLPEEFDGLRVQSLSLEGKTHGNPYHSIPKTKQPETELANYSAMSVYYQYYSVFMI